MIYNVINGSSYTHWSDVPVSTKEEILAKQAAVKFNADSTLSEKTTRVFNVAMALIAGMKLVTYTSIGSTLASMGFAAINASAIAYFPFISSIMAFAPQLICAVALLVVIRKVLAVTFNCLVYPAVLLSLFNKKEIDESRLKTFESFTGKQFECHRISFNKSGIDYDAFTFEHANTKGNGKWIILAGGNAMVGDKVAGTLVDEFEKSGFNILYVNGPGVGRSTGWPTSYSISAGQEAGLQFLEKVIKAKKIMMYGLSLGGGAQAEAILNHEFKTDTIDYLVWSDRTFDRLSNAASCMVTRLAIPIFFVLGIELDGVAAANKLRTLGISHIITQNNNAVIEAGPGLLPLDGPIDEEGTDDIIPNKASLFVGIRNAGINDSPRLKCYGGPSVEHNWRLPYSLSKLVHAEVQSFRKQHIL